MISTNDRKKIVYTISIVVLLLVVHQIRLFTVASNNPKIQRTVDTPISEKILDGLDGKIRINNKIVKAAASAELPTIQHDFTLDHDLILNKLELESKRIKVKEAFLHGWNGYKNTALGADELMPLSNKPNNPFGGVGATMIDSLSTMLIMGLQDQVKEVLPLIEKINFQDINEHISVFETVIRSVGGLLSAYELSDHPVFLRKAEEIAQGLLPAFDTPHGIPYYHFNPKKQTGESNTTYLADAGTIQLEFKTLSRHTGNPIYAEKAQAITDFLDQYKNISIPGLYPIVINVTSGKFIESEISFGAMGDSAYEYFLKEYLLTDGKVSQYARLYNRAIDSMKTNMLVQVPGSDYLYLPGYDINNMGGPKIMDHLTCFVPGMLAMGSKVFERAEDLDIAKRILEGCVSMYRSSATGLSPDYWLINNSVPFNPMYDGDSLVHNFDVYHKIYNFPANIIVEDGRYLLRPETLESLFILYRITGDPIYQQYGWDIFRAIDTYCRTPTAFASVKDVYSIKNRTKMNQLDSMETFLFAETFKYLYLLFSPPDIISLDKYVFNTEAHPLLRQKQ